VKASILALSRQGLTFIPAILILSRALGLFGIQTSQTFADGITFLIAIPLTAGTLRSFKGHPGDGRGKDEDAAAGPLAAADE